MLSGQQEEEQRAALSSSPALSVEVEATRCPSVWGVCVHPWWSVSGSASVRVFCASVQRRSPLSPQLIDREVFTA